MQRLDLSSCPRLSDESLLLKSPPPQQEAGSSLPPRLVVLRNSHKWKPLSLHWADSAPWPGSCSSCHLPGPLVVKEEDKKEPLSSLCLLLFAQLQHVQRRDRDGDTVVQEALPGHLGIDDLEAEEETGPEQARVGELQAQPSRHRTPQHTRVQFSM